LQRSGQEAFLAYCGSRELAGSFRTIRGNTVTIAEEIPENAYDLRAVPESRTIEPATKSRFEMLLSPEEHEMLARQTQERLARAHSGARP
jgi:hypothetical protein